MTGVFLPLLKDFAVLKAVFPGFSPLQRQFGHARGWAFSHSPWPQQHSQPQLGISTLWTSTRAGFGKKWIIWCFLPLLNLGYPEIMILRLILRLILEVESEKSQKSNHNPLSSLASPYRSKCSLKTNNTENIFGGIWYYIFTNIASRGHSNTVCNVLDISVFIQCLPFSKPLMTVLKAAATLLCTYLLHLFPLALLEPG